MNPLRLRAENYRTFETLNLHLPDGCSAIVGPNGAGKSSIVNIIELALFAARGELAPHLADTDDGDLLLELEFEHAGDVYRIRRGYSGRGRGKTTLDFEKAATLPGTYGDPWHTLTRETAQETQAEIEQTIGLTRETFRASAFLAQGDGAAFTEAAPKDRKRILAEVLGLDIYDRLLKRSQTERRDQEAILLLLEQQIGTGETEIASRADTIIERDAAERLHDKAQGSLELCETQLAETGEKAAAAREARAAHQAATELLHARETEAQRTRERIAGLALQETATRDQLAEKGALEERAAKVPALEQELSVSQNADRVRSERAALQARIDDLAQQAEKADSHDECPTCGQKLNEDARLAALGTLDGERALLIGQIQALPQIVNTRPPGNVEHDLRQARDAERQLAVLGEKEAQLAPIQAERARLTETLRNLDASVDHQRQEVERLQALIPEQDYGLQVEMLRANVARLRSEVTAHAAAVARCDERLDRIATIENTLRDQRDDYQKVQAELDLLHALEKAYGRDGIPALIVENAAIPAIELETNKLLARLPMSDGAIYRVALQTQAALKSGEGSRETLDIIVHGRNGPRPYETFSEGEKSRLNICLRIALSMLLAHRRGAESRILVCDEPEFLDSPARANLVRILHELGTEFDRVVFISQYDDVKEAFDQVLPVVLENGRSRVETGQREAVPA